MVMLGEVLSLATPQGIIMGKFWLLWVYKLQVNAFAAVVNLKMLSDPDVHTKPQYKYIFIFCEPETLFYVDIYT